MKQLYIKDGNIKAFQILNNKVLTTIDFNGLVTVNPTLEEFLQSGWSEYIPTPAEPYIPTLEEAVEHRIRERYSLNKELQIHRKRDEEPEEFKAYYEYVEECIKTARACKYRLV